MPLPRLREGELWDINAIACGCRLDVGESVRSEPGRKMNVTAPSRRGSRVIRSVTCVMNLVGRLTTINRCSRKISNRSLHTVTWAVFSSSPSLFGDAHPAAGKRRKERRQSSRPRGSPYG